MAQAGWYDDGSGTIRWWDGEEWSDRVLPPPADTPSPGGLIDKSSADAEVGSRPRATRRDATYVVLQVALKEATIGTGSGNLTELEDAINAQAALGYRLHTMTTATRSQSPCAC